MKILLGFRSISGSALRAGRIKLYLENLGHQVKTISNSTFEPFVQNIDWNTSALQFEYGKKVGPGELSLPRKSTFFKANKSVVESLLSEIQEFNPELVLSDLEPTSAKLAKVFGIPLWYYGTDILLTALNWKRLGRKIDFSNNPVLESTNLMIRKFLPEPDKVLVMSPLGHMVDWKLKPNCYWTSCISIWDLGLPSLNRNSKNVLWLWAKPERILSLIKLSLSQKNNTQIFSNKTFSYRNINVFEYNSNIYSNSLELASMVYCSGEGDWIYDLLLSKIPFVLTPDVGQSELLLHSMAFDYLGIAKNLWQVEYLNQFAVNVVCDAMNTKHELQKKHHTLPTLQQQLGCL